MNSTNATLEIDASTVTAPEAVNATTPAKPLSVFLAELTRVMGVRPFYQRQMAQAAASGEHSVALARWQVSAEQQEKLKAQGLEVEAWGAFVSVSWRRVMESLPVLLLIFTLTACGADASPSVPQAERVVMMGTDAEGEGFTITRPVASDEEPLTDAQREAIAFRELPSVEDALQTGSLVLTVAEHVGWTVAVVIVVSLVWVLLCKWAAALGRAVHPPQRAGDDDFTPTPFERDALCDDARDRFRRSSRRLHISRLDESRLDLRNW